MLMCRNTWHILKAYKISTKSQYLCQLIVKMNSIKIPGQQTLDLKRYASILQIPSGNKHLNSKKIPYDIRRMRCKVCLTITCLRIWIIHIHIVTSYQNRLGLFKLHHKEFSASFKCFSLKYVCSDLPTIVGVRIINIYVCKVHSLQLVCQHQFYTDCS